MTSNEQREWKELMETGNQVETLARHLQANGRPDVPSNSEMAKFAVLGRAINGVHHGISIFSGLYESTH